MFWNLPRGRILAICSAGRVDKRMLGLSYLILIFGIFALFNGDNVSYMTKDSPKRLYNNGHVQKREVKKILIWTPFLGDDIAELEHKCLQDCKAKCAITTDKTDVSNVDAINFHLSDLWTKRWRIGTRSIIQLPVYRRPDQVWIVSNMEPPQHLWGDLKVFNGLFNWTQWYRTDADIQWLYGQPFKLNEREQLVSYKKMSKRNIFKEKTKEICGRISNCMDSNRRYITIKQMQKDLDIEMFGLCYNNPCGDTMHERDVACSNILKQYKFYLAFENNDCKDYVTEKYWEALARDQIPIVNWMMLNRSMVIPNSYINIYDFKDIDTLTRYIKKVSENESLYNNYFHWKTSYTNRPRCPSCQICEALHDETRKVQVIQDLDGWVRNDICGKVGYFDDIKKHIQYYMYRLTGL